MSDTVNHPKHYNFGEIEVIDFIDQVTKGYSKEQAYYVGNIIKYISRAPFKNGVEDLQKAQWYLNRLLDNQDTLKDKEIEPNHEKVIELYNRYGNHVVTQKRINLHSYSFNGVKGSDYDFIHLRLSQAEAKQFKKAFNLYSYDALQRIKDKNRNLTVSITDELICLNRILRTAITTKVAYMPKTNSLNHTLLESLLLKIGKGARLESDLKGVKL